MDYEVKLHAKIAHKFSDILMAELGLNTMMNICNNNRRSKRGCATHDYVDANMVMEEAFEEVTKRHFNVDSDEDVALWNAAWDLAKTEDFFIDWGDLHHKSLHPEVR